MDTVNIEDGLKALTERMGYEFVSVETVREGGKDVLRLYADRAGGFSLDDCERLAKEVDAKLDETDGRSGAYLLEISSPGLERPLFKIDDYRRFAGREANVRFAGVIQGKRRFRGTIDTVSDETVSFRGEDGTLEVPFSCIMSARLVYVEEKGRKKSFKKSGGRK